MAYPPTPMQQRRPPGAGVAPGTPGPTTWGTIGQRPGASPFMPGQGAGAPTNPKIKTAEQGGQAGTFYDAPGRTPGSYNADAAGSNGPAPGWATDTLRNRYTDAMNRTGTLAERGENDFYDRAEGFDARQYAGQAAQGMFDQFMPKLQEAVGDMRGQEVSMGRLDTGFGTQDEDRLVRGGLEDLNHQVAGLSMTAAGMDQRNTEDLGQMGESMGNRYMDQVSGALDRKTAQQNAKKKFGFGDILKAGASLVPALI
jgi:hypothetical protein